MPEMPFDETDRQRLLEYFGITQEDLEILRSSRETAKRVVPPIIDDLYSHFFSFPETAALLPGGPALERVRAGFWSYYLRFSSGEVREEFFQQAWHVGEVHDRIGVQPRWYMGCCAKFLSSLYPSGESVGDAPPGAGGGRL